MILTATILLAPFQQNMTTVQCVFLVAPNQPKLVTKNLLESYQARHTEIVESLWSKGIVAAAGRVDGDAYYKGISVFRSKSAEEVRELLRFDPLVKNGVVDLEIVPWMVEDVFKKGPKFSDRQTMLFGILARPNNAPNYDKAKLDQLQAGHMANIGRMAKDGLLYSAGPFLAEGKRRGIFIFGTTDRKKVQAECAKDAAIAAGRLELHLMDWRISKGTLFAYPK